MSRGIPNSPRWYGDCDRMVRRFEFFFGVLVSIANLKSFATSKHSVVGCAISKIQARAELDSALLTRVRGRTERPPQTPYKMNVLVCGHCSSPARLWALSALPSRNSCVEEGTVSALSGPTQEGTLSALLPELAPQPKSLVSNRRSATPKIGESSLLRQEPCAAL